jgi:cation:H+ antiporter
LNPFGTSLDHLGAWGPWLFVVLFIDASFLMIWRLESLSARGIEGTVLGTLVMPYCSGVGNLVFVLVMSRQGGPGTEVLTNCLVNNVTNMTFLIGLPAVFWGLSVIPTEKGRRKKKEASASKLNRLSLLLTLMAVLFFSGALWALGRDGSLTFSDGIVLVGLFLFWQCFHVFDVLKSNVRQNKTFSTNLWLDLVLLVVGAYAIYLSVDWLVNWISTVDSGFISAKKLGWLSGWLMVLPNGMLALYYGWKRRAEVVYTSQVGDGHICIPLCVGIFPLFRPMTMPPFFEKGIAILVGATLVHIIFVITLGKLPRAMGAVMIGLYGIFLYLGLI